MPVYLFIFKLINILAMLDIDKTPLNLISLLLKDHEFIISNISCGVSCDVSGVFCWADIPGLDDVPLTSLQPPDGSLITPTWHCPHLWWMREVTSTVAKWGGSGLTPVPCGLVLLRCNNEQVIRWHPLLNHCAELDILRSSSRVFSAHFFPLQIDSVYISIDL